MDCSRAPLGLHLGNPLSGPQPGLTAGPIRYLMPFPHKFQAIRSRQFFLSPSMVQRLGGEQAAEIMRLLVEEGSDPLSIQKKLGIGASEYDTFTLTHLFKRELKAQLKLRAHDQKFRQTGELRPGPLAKQPLPDPSIPGHLRKINLPKGITPAEYALKRINEVTPEAVEKLVFLMHNSRNETTQYNAATKLLGLNGIVEVEKSISVIADAEAIIRELNKRGPYKPKEIESVVDAEVVVELKESSDTPGRAESVGDSTPSAQETPANV